MRHVLLTIALLATSLVASAAEKAEAVWLTDYTKAIAQAKAENKVVLADFTGSDWCGWCIKLKKEVFDTPEFKAWAAKSVVLLEVDYPRKKELSAKEKAQNDSLGEQFEIQGYPTIVFIDANGKEISRGGYAKGGPAAWIKKHAVPAGLKP